MRPRANAIIRVGTRPALMLHAWCRSPARRLRLASDSVSLQAYGAKQQFSKVFAVLGALPQPSKTRFAKLTVLRRDACSCFCAAAPCSLVRPARPTRTAWAVCLSLTKLGRLRAAETPSLTHPSPQRGAYLCSRIPGASPWCPRERARASPAGEQKKGREHRDAARPCGPAST